MVARDSRDLFRGGKLYGTIEAEVGQGANVVVDVYQQPVDVKVRGEHVDPIVRIARQELLEEEVIRVKIAITHESDATER